MKINETQYLITINSNKTRLSTQNAHEIRTEKPNN